MLAEKHPTDARAPETAKAASSKPPRDQRLDYFRGLGMLIIFAAHAPGNPWNNWIPARFGFSSATELFVFCSGLASAFAFGSVFVKRGWHLGAVRIAYRVWQVYWAHISLFMALAALAVMVRQWGGGDAYFEEHVAPIANDPGGAILALLTLRWLPGYLDILPMYLVILGTIPVMMALRRMHTALPFVLSLALYASVWLFALNISGNPWTGFGWFFNPFAWQLIFFIGFAIGLGWIKPPALGRRDLIFASAAFVAISVPLSFWGILNQVPALQAAHDFLLGGVEKTDLHPLRIVHFLCVAYLVLSFVSARNVRFTSTLSQHIIKVGQQSLASFLLSLVVARIAGVAFAMIGSDALTATAINIAGLSLIVLGAHLVGWFKSSPWAKPKSSHQITDQ